jgi:hypothetical protein
MPLVLRFNGSSNSNYRLWNDTGHGSWVSITGQGGAKLSAATGRQTAIYRAIYKKRSVLICSSTDRLHLYSSFFAVSTEIHFLLKLV